jgi:hypothetical protein
MATVVGTQASSTRFTSERRSRWEPPVLKRLHATDAEILVAGSPDAGVNKS